MKVWTAVLTVLWSAVLLHVSLVGRKVFTNPKPEDCPFCQAYNSTRFRYYEDETLFALRDDQPDCTVHILVLPVAHVKDILSAEKETVQQLSDKCDELLENTGGTGEKVKVFHRPPYYSQPHLHLHCKLCTPADLSLFSSRGIRNWMERWTALTVDSALSLLLAS